MKKTDPFKADDRMVKTIFWIIIGLFVSTVFCIMGSWIWVFWLVTKVVTS